MGMSVIDCQALLLLNGRASNINEFLSLQHIDIESLDYNFQSTLDVPQISGDYLL